MTRIALPLLVSFAAAIAGCGETRLSGSVPFGAAPGAAMVAPPVVAVAEAGATAEIEARRVETGEAGVFRRVAVNRGYETWRARDGSALVLRDGLVAATYALGHDLYSADARATSALLARGADGSARRVHRYLDGENHLRAVAFACEVRIGAAERTSQGRLVRRASETCHSEDTEFRNTYVMSADGYGILASTQWVGPEIGALGLGGPAGEDR